MTELPSQILAAGLRHHYVRQQQMETAGVAYGKANGVARVHGEVDDDLLDLAGVSPDGSPFGARQNQQLDILSDYAAQHFTQVRDHRVDCERRRLGRMPPAESQQLPGKSRGLYRRL